MATTTSTVPASQTSTTSGSTSATTHADAAPAATTDHAARFSKFQEAYDKDESGLQTKIKAAMASSKTGDESVSKVDKILKDAGFEDITMEDIEKLLCPVPEERATPTFTTKPEPPKPDPSKPAEEVSLVTFTAVYQVTEPTGFTPSKFEMLGAQKKIKSGEETCDVTATRDQASMAVWCEWKDKANSTYKAKFYSTTTDDGTKATIMFDGTKKTVAQGSTPASDVTFKGKFLKIDPKDQSQMADAAGKYSWTAIFGSVFGVGLFLYWLVKKCRASIQAANDQAEKERLEKREERLLKALEGLHKAAETFTATIPRVAQRQTLLEGMTQVQREMLLEDLKTHVVEAYQTYTKEATFNSTNKALNLQNADATFRTQLTESLGEVMKKHIEGMAEERLGGLAADMRLNGLLGDVPTEEALQKLVEIVSERWANDFAGPNGKYEAVTTKIVLDLDAQRLKTQDGVLQVSEKVLAEAQKKAEKEQEALTTQIKNVGSDVEKKLLLEKAQYELKKRLEKNGEALTQVVVDRESVAHESKGVEERGQEVRERETKARENFSSGK